MNRKKLEAQIATARAILGAGGRCTDLPRSQARCRDCPADTGDACDGISAASWRVLVADLEAKLATLDAVEPVGPLVQTGAIPAGDPSFRFIDRPPTIDDFARSVVEGGNFNPYDAAYGEQVYRAAEKLKAESDRRRGV